MPAPLRSEPFSGIAELHQLSKKSAHTLVSAGSRPLLSPADQESFLRELEGAVPDWTLLHDQPNEEPGERLFAFNRTRDEAREGHPLLNQRIAFLWSGMLRQFVPQHQGFSVAMGPDVTQTDWGVVRFKPMGLPQEMIAIPSTEILGSLQKRLAQGETVEIQILFSGHLIPHESIIYAFSHEDISQGMIMPVVQTEDVKYFFQLTP